MQSALPDTAWGNAQDDGPVQLPALLRACHPGPTAAVTAVATLLAVDAELDPLHVVLAGTAVLAGQLTIGWTNDAVDSDRDRQVHRLDKPVATGEVSGTVIRTAAVSALLACIVLSGLLGWRSAVCHLALGVASGLAYDLGVKRTVWSWAPYALAFGALPGVITFAQSPPEAPAWWLSGAAALLGVGAHLLNALPDLDEDDATGVRGLPHRLGARASQTVAAVLFLVASVVLTLGPGTSPGTLRWLLLVLTIGLAGVASTGRGRTPFRATMVIAVVDVVLLAVGS